MARTDALTETLKGMHVLVVDDDRDSLEILRTILSYFGALTSEARSAARAVATLRRVLPDVLVIDLLMPERDGLSLVRELRTTPSTARIPAVALTGHPDVHSRAIALNAGFDAYLTKPVDPMALCRLLAQLAGRS